MSKPARPRAERRSRGEIDRNYYFGSVLIKSGVAALVAILAIAAYTPFSLRDAIVEGRYAYLGVMAAFGAVGLGAYLVGRHLRHEATHWDFD